MVLPDALAVLTPYVGVGNIVGKLATQLAEGQFSSVEIIYAGDIAQYDTLFLKAAVVGGLLAPVSEERVNVVNVNMVAAQRGMRIAERKEEANSTYRNLLRVEVTTSAGTTVVAGTHIAGRAHIAQINNYPMDITTGESGYMLLIENQDRPGMIGAVGTLAGQHDVNISFMEVGRLERRGRAMMVIGIDEPMPEEALKKVRQMTGILSARIVRV
jgi:D-3-phosphoglycerate dehydrogenase